MIQKASELRLKEVISVNDGKKLGNIYYMELDTETGQIKSVIIPGGGKLLGFLGRGEEFVISWDKVQKIGLDIVLVDDKDLFMPE